MSNNGWIGEETNEQYHNDNILLSTLNTHSEHFLSLSAIRTLDATCYVSRDRTIENMYPFVFTAKMQAHALDNPTYGDDQRPPPLERKLWDDTMVK